MKKLPLTTFVLVFVVNQVNAQRLTEISGFGIQGKDAIWTQIYPCGGTKDSIHNVALAHIQRNKAFTNVIVTDDEISTTIVHYWVDFRKNAGVGSSAGFDGFWDADVTIQVKDGKYRVIVSNLVEDVGRSASSVAFANAASSRSKELILDFSSWTLTPDRLAFKDDKTNKVVVMNSALSYLFDIKQKPLTNKDW